MADAYMYESMKPWVSVTNRITWTDTLRKIHHRFDVAVMLLYPHGSVTWLQTLMPSIEEARSELTRHLIVLRLWLSSPGITSEIKGGLASRKYVIQGVAIHTRAGYADLSAAEHDIRSVEDGGR